MGFMEDVAKFGAEDKKCPTAKWLDSDKAKGVTDALLDQGVATHGVKAVFLAAREKGFSGSQESISKHARKVCSCLRK